MARARSTRTLRAATALAGILVACAPARAASLEEVVDCAVGGLPPSAHGGFVLEWRGADGAEKRVEGKYWAEQPVQGARKVIVASAGARAAYLFSEGDAVGQAWLWTPDQPAARRVDARGDAGELFGTDLSFEDFARFARLSFPGQLRRLDDAEIDGRRVYVVETRPAPDSGSEYSRIVTSLDQERCVVLARDGYEPDFASGEKPRMRLRVDPKDVKSANGFARATRAVLHDERDGSSTRVELVDLALDAKLADAFFTPENLPQTAK